MAIHDIDFEQVGNNLLPPDKRDTKHKAWIKALLYPLTWLMAIWEWFRNGQYYVTYDAGDTYAIGDKVLEGGILYEAIATVPISTPPPDADYWEVVLLDAPVTVNDEYKVTGSEARKMYNSQKTLFEYALNAQFEGTFAQPPTLSDIYVVTTSATNNSFIVGLSETDSSSVSATRSSAYVYSSWNTGISENFTINIPTALHATITGGDEAIRQFADRYVLAGITYTIDQY